MIQMISVCHSFDVFVFEQHSHVISFTPTEPLWQRLQEQKEAANAAREELYANRLSSFLRFVFLFALLPSALQKYHGFII